VLRWSRVELEAGLVRVVEFVSTLGHELVPSTGKSRDAVRTIDLDEHLVAVLRRQRKLQAEEKLASVIWTDSDYVFTKPVAVHTTLNTYLDCSATSRQNLAYPA